jgi:exodeoxyribonuclease VII small subunit
MSEPVAAPADTQPEDQASTPVPADVERLAFDQALAELQSVVGRLEAGGLPLESSIELYERGVALHAHCARLLSQAELRVQRLVEGAGGRLAVLDLRPDDEP